MFRDQHTSETIARNGCDETLVGIVGYELFDARGNSKIIFLEFNLRRGFVEVTVW